MRGAVQFLLGRWFLVSLAVLVPTGLMIGRTATSPASVDFVAPLAGVIVPVVLFLMSITLDSKQLLKSLSRPIPVLWACGVNAVLLPLIAFPFVLWQLTDDFRVGLAISASVPCTMAAASVWTRRAGGNDAVSLLTTLLTNGLCFAYTPISLALLAGQEVEMDVAAMAWRLFKTALVPAAVGQIARAILLNVFPLDRIKTLLGVLAQIGILLIVFGASAKAGPRLAELGATEGSAVAVMAASCLLVHLIAAAVAYIGGRVMNFATGDATACLFAGSQKTLPIGLLIATDPAMLGGANIPLAAFPILVYHMLQLFGDTVIADVLKKRAGQRECSSETAKRDDAAVENVVSDRPEFDR